MSVVEAVASILGDDLLIEQRRFDRCPFAGQSRCQHGDREAVVQRFRPQARQQSMAVLMRRFHQVNRAEAARIDEADPPAVVGLQFQVLVQGDVVAPDRLQQHAPRHAEVQQHRPAAVEPHQDVFRPPAEAGHPRPGQPGGEPRGQRPAQVGAAGDGAQQHPSLQARLQASHHGFDFGEFRHGRVSRYTSET